MVAARAQCTELKHLYKPNNASMTSLASVLGGMDNIHSTTWCTPPQRQPRHITITGALVTMRPLSDLKHVAHSLGGLLRSGLGRFGLHKQPVPGDHGVVFVFFIGGVCMQEIADLRTTVVDKGRRVVVGGTALLNTTQVLACAAG